MSRKTPLGMLYDAAHQDSSKAIDDAVQQIFNHVECSIKIGEVLPFEKMPMTTLYPKFTNLLRKVTIELEKRYGIIVEFKSYNHATENGVECHKFYYVVKDIL